MAAAGGQVALGFLTSGKEAIRIAVASSTVPDLILFPVPTCGFPWSTFLSLSQLHAQIKDSQGALTSEWGLFPWTCFLPGFYLLSILFDL